MYLNIISEKELEHKQLRLCVNIFQKEKGVNEMSSLTKGDLAQCQCMGCLTKITVMVDGVHPGMCNECSQDKAHHHDATGKYVADTKLPWEKKGEEYFVKPD